MKNWITRWIVSALALFIITQIPGVGVTLTSHNTAAFTSLGIATVAIGLANSLIRPIVMLLGGKIVNCLTFGLFGLVLNTILFWLVGTFVPGFKVSGPVAALIGSVAMGVISGLLNFLLKDRGEKDSR